MFKHLNEEARKTKTEKEKDERKWTTFLQKPDRPIPKSKADLEREARIPYRVKIVKQAKPKCDPNRPPSPPAPAKPVEPQVQQAPVEEKAAEPAPEVAKTQENPVESPVEPTEAVVEQNGTNEPDLSIVEDGFAHTPSRRSSEEQQALDQQPAEVVAEEPPQKSAEDILLEKQLNDVQKQLLALSTLPSTIQATLDAVAKQLEELVPVIKAKALTPKNSLVPETNDEIGVAQDAVEGM